MIALSCIACVNASHSGVFRYRDTFISSNCENCTCQYGGNITCYPVDCPATPCSNPVKVSGDCCLKCPGKVGINVN